MNTQHTPGPWSVELDHATNTPEFIRTHIDGEMHDIASLLCDETGNASANARLIRSAPELLDAAQLALRALNVAPRFKVPGAGDSYEVCSELERVLRKIEGAAI
jgi:hypothetical protein